RRRLAAYFVQRRRVDIEAWNEPGVFPQRETAEATYRLSGEHLAFLDNVLDYCAGITLAGGADERTRRLAFWSTLALMRCGGSSPLAALHTLRTRAFGDEIDPETFAERFFDGEESDLADDDTEPGADLGDPALAVLIDKARTLAGSFDRDPKYQRLR